MKKYILIFGILALLISSGLKNANAQNILPDSRFTVQYDSAIWFPDGTAYCSYNGATYGFIWQREERPVPELDPKWSWYPYVYILKDNDLKPYIHEGTNKFKFGYKHEDDYGYGGAYRAKVSITGNAYAFSYFGFMFWSCVIEHPPYNGYYPGTYYRLWARYNYDSLNWTTWYEELDEEPAKYGLGAFQVDSLLHMVYYDATEDNNGVPAGLGEDIYTFNPSTRNIVLMEHTSLSLPGTRYGGMFAYVDTCGNTNYIYNTCSEGLQGCFTLKGPLLETSHFYYYSAGASVIAQGSAQGERPAETVHPEMGNRFNGFYLGTSMKTDKSYPLYNCEWIIPDNCQSMPFLARTSEITLPTTCVPQQVDGSFQLGLSYGMIPKDFVPPADSLDGISKQIQVFYPDQDGQIYEASFNSDNWRPVPGSSVSNIDLDEDETYGPEIRNLWTLVGITDGAPPCSINWERWEEMHSAVVEPTEFKFSIETESTGEVTSTYEDAYSIGGKINIGIEEIMEVDMSFTYANTFKSMVSSGKTITTTLTTPFGLNDESQELGFYIWNIPQITRTSYMVYPWYDAACEHPIINSLQYQFRTMDAFLTKENIENSRFPFLINEPNDTNLYDFTQAGRPLMMSSATSNGLAPLKTITWVDPTNGQSLSFSEVDATTSSVEQKNSYKWEEGTSFAIPGIFKIGVTSEQEVSYTSEYKYDTKFGQEVEISLNNLIKQADGPNFKKYNVSTYWFKPKVADWWYLDSMDGQKPWYIAYIVSGLQTKLQLLSPAPASNLRGSDLLFSWQAVDGELSDYQLFISTDPTAGPGSTIYRLACSDRMLANPEDFKPEPGKTYYWSVRGTASTGETVWSDSRAFTVGIEEPGGTPSLLKASIYPNPGKISDIKIAIDPETEGKIIVRLTDINGALVAAKEMYCENGLPLTVSFSGLSLPAGIYLAVISTEDGQIVKKVIVR